MKTSVPSGFMDPIRLADCHARSPGRGISARHQRCWLLDLRILSTSRRALQLFFLYGRLQEHERVVRHHNIHPEMNDRHETVICATVHLLGHKLMPFCAIATCGGVSRPATMVMQVSCPISRFKDTAVIMCMSPSRSCCGIVGTNFSQVTIHYILVKFVGRIYSALPATCLETFQASDIGTTLPR